jgi:polyketide biosynthesis enoyl-CoA hydratase PksI
MLYTGRLLKGRELARAGSPLAHAVLPRAEVRERRPWQIAGDIAAVPRPTLVELKRLLVSRRRAALDGVLERECAAQDEAAGDGADSLTHRRRRTARRRESGGMMAATAWRSRSC